MHATDHRTSADLLEHARRHAEPIAPLSETASGLTVEDAFAIAQLGVQARVADGARLVGYKIGLTSAAVQEQLGVDQPDYGALLDDMELPDGGLVPAGRLIAPRVELEFAFHLKADLRGPGVTDDDVIAATGSVQPAIEIVDSRVADWRITLADTVADNASSGAFVLGGERVALNRLVPAECHVSLESAGRVVESGRADAVLGDPVRAVTWLANALGALDLGLEAGHVVLSGACTRMVGAQPGDAFRGDFGPFGSVAIAFEATS